MWGRGERSHFIIGCPVAPAPLIEKAILSPAPIVSLYQTSWPLMCESISGVSVLYSVPVAYLCVFGLIPHCLNYCCFMISLDIWHSEFSSFAFLQEYLNFSRLSVFPYKFRIRLSIFILIKIAWNRYINWGEIDIVTAELLSPWSWYTFPLPKAKWIPLLFPVFQSNNIDNISSPPPACDMGLLTSEQRLKWMFDLPEPKCRPSKRLAGS